MNLDEWSRFGWQGIEFDIPAEWGLSKIEGDRNTGYLRIDDEDMVRLEGKWSAAQKGKYDLEKEIANQLKQLDKRARKAGLETTTRRKLKLVRFKERSWECFYWKGDFVAYNLLTYCEGCGRVLLLRVLFREDEPAREVSRRVFESISDHNEECRDYWSVFGLKLNVPTNFTLKKSSLKTGEIRLLFDREKKEQLEVIRVSLAEYHLRERTLEQWFERFMEKELRPFAWTQETARIHEHRGFLLEGRLRMTRRLLPFKRRHLACHVWNCQESDKLFILHSTLKDPNDPVFEEICASIECH